MFRRTSSSQREGTIIPLLAVCMIGIFSFVALAIDVGMLTVARSHCQNAADIAALAGTRTLDGKNANNNLTAAIAEAKDAAKANKIFNNNITDTNIQVVSNGVFRYNTSSNRFQANFTTTPTTQEAWGVMQVRIGQNYQPFFGRLMGASNLSVSATATAVHRPRDVAIVLDFSGSMGNGTQYNYDSSGIRSLSADPRFPRFGPWSVYNNTGWVMDPNNPGTAPANLNTWVPPTPMQRVWQYVDGGGESYGPSNITQETRNGPAMVSNFLLSDNTTNAFVRANPTAELAAFANVRDTAAAASNPTTIITPVLEKFWNQSETGFLGDKFPLRRGQTVTGTTAPTAAQYAHTVADLLDGLTSTDGGYVINRGNTTNATRYATWETNGYDYDYNGTPALKAVGQRFQGFTVGPGYFGKTFYMWPPDPRQPNANIGDTNYVPGDWRRRFFTARSGSGQDTSDNSMFWDTGSERWRTQNVGTAANYIVNYDAILAWLTRGPRVFPTSLRQGRVVYYDAIPTTIPIDMATGRTTTGATSDQRFWKDYIDFVLGSGRFTDSAVLFGANSNNRNSDGTTTINYNNPSTTGLAAKITAKANLTATGNPLTKPYMRYDDNPIHPRAQFWFGPMSLMCFLQQNGNWYSGTSYESQCWQLKAGVNSAINDIKNNHPNDLASIIYFSGRDDFNVPRVVLSKDYTRMQNSLFYPFGLLDSLGNANSTIRPYGTQNPSDGNPAGLTNNFTSIPNADSYTSPQMGFLVAYNQFSSATGFNGRRGASKIVIFETDGVPNTTCSQNFVNGGAGFSRYTGITGSTYIGQSTTLNYDPKNKARAVVRQITALETATNPGYSTTRMAAQVHSIGFGYLFEPSTSGNTKTAALEFLFAVQVDGKTTPSPGGTWDQGTVGSINLTPYTVNESYKIITGTYTERIDKLKDALERIMQGGVQVALIQ